MSSTTGSSIRPDPRIARTRIHVLNTARQMIRDGSVALTITSIAEAAKVSRRTLYSHWGEVENLVADTIQVGTLDDNAFLGLDCEERASLFVTNFAQEMTDGGAKAIANVMSAATYSSEAGVALTAMTKGMRALYSERVQAISYAEYAQIFFPLILTAVSEPEIPEELLVASISRARDFIRRDTPQKD